MVDWKSVGVSWVLATVTVVILFSIYKFIMYMYQKRKKTSKGLNNRLAWIESQEKPEVKCGLLTTGLETGSSKTNGNSTSSGMTSSSIVPSRPQTADAGRRGRRDEVTRWCNDHGLPESMVYILRNQGFETKSALDSIRPEDLEPGLGGTKPAVLLPNTAAKVQLREALVKMRNDSNSTYGAKGTSSRGSSTKPTYRRRDESSTSDSGIASVIGLPSPVNTTSDSVFPENDEIDSFLTCPVDKRRRVKTKSKEMKEEKELFHGLLSDQGLWELSGMLGHEWRHLAIILGVSSKTQERLMEQHHHNVRNVIYETLRTWKDSENRTKEQIKGKLLDALTKVERIDIAKKIMEEQLHGSYDDVHRKITSVI